MHECFSGLLLSELSETVNSMVMHFSCGSIFSLVVFLAVTGIVGILLFLLLLSSSNHRLKLPWLILQARKSRPNVKTRCRCLETTQPTIGGIPVQVLIIFFSICYEESSSIVRTEKDLSLRPH